MRFLTLVVLAIAASACSSGSSSTGSSTGAGSSTGVVQTCLPGATVKCQISGVCTGVQTCPPDGSAYGACTCPATTGTTSGGAATGTSTGGSTGGETIGGTGTTGGTGTGGATSSGSTTGSLRIGQECDSTATCPGTQTCFLTNGTKGICTIPCGEGADAPPDAGFELCANTLALGGTPDCGPGTFFTTNSDGGNTWYCALLCGHLGSTGGTDEGTCPPKLTCNSNICE